MRSLGTKLPMKEYLFEGKATNNVDSERESLFLIDQFGSGAFHGSRSRGYQPIENEAKKFSPSMERNIETYMHIVVHSVSVLDRVNTYSEEQRNCE